MERQLRQEQERMIPQKQKTWQKIQPVSYTHLDVYKRQGKEKKGTMEGKSVEQVSGVLKAQKNVILSVSEASLMNRDINFSLGGRVSARDYSIFCRQFVSIISAGVSIINALEMMRDQTENRTLKKALGEVYEDVSKGESMAGAMKKHSKVFPSMLCLSLIHICRKETD